MKTSGELDVLEKLSINSGYRLRGVALEQAFKEYQIMNVDRGPYKSLPPVNLEKFFIDIYKSIQEWRIYRRDHIDPTQSILPPFPQHMGGNNYCRMVYGFNPSKYDDLELIRIGFKEYRWYHVDTETFTEYKE